MTNVKPLSPAHLRIVALLTEADGAFVDGRTLAGAAKIPFDILGGWMAVIRRHRPDLVIEAKRGQGYRIGKTVAPPAVALITTTSGGTVPLHRRMAANMAILDLLPAKTAEMVKAVALQAGEDVDATLHRLISYGVEVHNDLVFAGENPIALRRAKAGGRDEQVLH
jgi:hypothetical protein